MTPQQTVAAQLDSTPVDAAVAPDAIMRLGLGFWGSKALLTAVELGLFTTLARLGPRSVSALIDDLGLQPRGTLDWLDALVALGMLDRTDDGYANTPATEQFLDRDKPTYIGGMLEMSSARLWRFWGSLTEALRTGAPQNEHKIGQDFFAELYAEPARLRQFLEGMTGLSLASAKALAEGFEWGRYRTVIDVGTAQGCLPVQLARRHPHLSGGGFDLPLVAPVFAEYVASHGLADRLRFHAGDFFTDRLPAADVLVMGHILHDWSLAEKQLLVGKAFDALPPDGR